MPNTNIISPKAAGKRKTRVVSDSSIEIVEPPSTSPQKKKRVVSKSKVAARDQLIYDAMPSVSISDRLDAILSPVAASTADNSATTTSTDGAPPVRSSRVRVKTEKGLLLESTAKKSVSPSKPAAKVKVSVSDDDLPPSTPAPKPAAKVEVSTPDDDLLAVPFLDQLYAKDKRDSSDVHLASDELPIILSSAVSDISDVDDTASEEDASVPLSDTAEEGGTSLVTGLPALLDVSDKGVEIRAGLDVSEDESGSDMEDPNVVEVPTSLDGLDTCVVADADAVMCKPLQDPALYRIYEGLPVLGPLRGIRAYGTRDGEMTQGDSVRFTPLCKRLTERTIDLLLKALTFTSAGSYVNTSRVDPKLLGVEHRRIVMAKTSNNMVGIMPAMIEECFLVKEFTGGSANSPYTIHKASVVTFPQEFRRDLTVWGQLLDFTSIVGSITKEGVLSFHTRPKNATTVVPTTPKKSRNSMFMTVSSPSTPSKVRAGGSTTGGAFYPASRAFEETIPIYDGRARTSHPFNFTDADFKKLPTWPLYRRGLEDVSPNALVAVGYTVNLWDRSAPSGTSTQLSTNIQFLILLGVAAAAP